ncbi:MAG: hypothetical protein R3E01_19785 [Pirellulaceae bacterium]
MQEHKDRQEFRRQKCVEEMIHCWGTYSIFDHRAKVLGRRLFLLQSLGLAVPAAVAGVVTTLGVDSKLVPYFLTVAGILATVQGVMSAIAMTAKWEDVFAYAKESMSSNRRLSDRFRELMESPPSQDHDAELIFQVLSAENNQRSDGDEKQQITEDEKRRGHRLALRHYQHKCAACGKVPTSLNPSECDVCGNFKVWSI